MKAAFETLGIPTWHWVTMAENPPDMAMWGEALEAKFASESAVKPLGRAGFDSLLSDWGATTDMPASFLAEELIEAYPEAKVVLVERDPDRWFKSYCETVIKGSASPFIPFICLFDRVYIGQMAALTDLIARYMFRVSEPRTRYFVFNNPAFFSQWRRKAKDVYLAHNERIKNITPEERLLKFKLEEGWEPLCAFLQKPIPKVPFPRVNETDAVKEKINVYIAEGYKRSLNKFAKRAAPVLIVVVGIFLWRSTA